jgi:hypothetical protein
MLRIKLQQCFGRVMRPRERRQLLPPVVGWPAGADRESVVLLTKLAGMNSNCMQSISTNRQDFNAMKCLLLIAHGSRRQSANDEIRLLAERVAALDDNDYDAVVTAFLEMAEPDIHQGIAKCVEQGATSIVVVPYFLAGGNHVTKDIPGEIACARAGMPQVDIEISRYLGSSDAMANLVLACSRQTD